MLNLRYWRPDSGQKLRYVTQFLTVPESALRNADSDLNPALRKKLEIIFSSVFFKNFIFLFVSSYFLRRLNLTLPRFSNQVGPELACLQSHDHNDLHDDASYNRGFRNGSKVGVFGNFGLSIPTIVGVHHLSWPRFSSQVGPELVFHQSHAHNEMHLTITITKSRCCF